MTQTWTPEAAYEVYRPNFEFYSSIAQTLSDRLLPLVKGATRAEPMIRSRAKDPLEFFKKVKRKGYVNPWTQCPDLVGARIIVPTADLKSEVVSSLQASSDLEVIRIEDQQAEAKPDSLRYYGLHVHVTAPDFVTDGGIPVMCEIQVRTMAEHAWSETEHRFIYKKPIDIPYEVRRTFARLLVLVELFDEELSKGAGMVQELESFKQLELARHLESVLAGFSDTTNDMSMTLSHLTELTKAGYGPLDQLANKVDAYVAQHSDTVHELFRAFSPDTPAFDVSTDWFLHQAEALLVLALLEEDEYRLGTALEDSDLYRPVESIALRTDHPGFVVHS